ncbi:MAG: c-type cytochrome biogenesis protein CcmI [Beijerinckiaceae bacterium]
MAIWIFLALMTGAAVLLLLWPLARRRGGTAQAADDVAFYRAQVAEIDRDAAAGLIGAPEAEAARTEAARRLLRASGEAMPSPLQASATRAKLASLLALIAIPAIALPLYLRTGVPSLPGQPLAERRSADPAKVDVAEAVARIEAHLAKNPEDGRGYEVVAPVYFRMERYADAVRAWSQAIRILGETPPRLSSLAEAQIANSGGVVTPDAKTALMRAQALEPGHVKARFYLAMAREQDGDKDGARADLEAIIKDQPADAPWVQSIRERIVALGGTPAAIPPGGEAIASMAPQERDAAIRSMVDGLEARLGDQGGTVEEWSRLVRALTVLGDKPRALKALAASRAKLQADQNALGILDALAKELGLQS